MGKVLVNVTQIVAQQYTDWAYPKPIDDMLAAIARGMHEPDTPALIAPRLWPERRSLDDLKILVAGCGTNQGAYYALMMPRAHVTGIDLSSTSLNHEKFLKEKHDIHNLTLHRMSLLDVRELNETYDFIVCCGVLHHLDDPDEGLRALKNVLRPDGLMSVMVYAPYLRQGIYMLQEAFKLLGLGRSKESIDLVKATLKFLPVRHPASFYIKHAPDIGYDSGIVDTFLHAQDRAYTVGEALQFVRKNGLDFWSWIEPAMYSAREAFAPDHPLRHKILALPEEEKWKLIELLTQRFGFHQFFLCHPERIPKKIMFDQPDWKNFVPVFSPGLKIVEQDDDSEPHVIKLARARYKFKVGRGANLIKLVDGQRPISEIATLALEKVPEMTRDWVRSFFTTMHESGHLMYWRMRS